MATTITPLTATPAAVAGIAVGQQAVIRNTFAGTVDLTNGGVEVGSLDVGQELAVTSNAPGITAAVRDRSVGYVTTNTSSTSSIAPTTAARRGVR